VEFRDALLADALRGARRRRWRRRAGRTALALAAGCALGLLVWRGAPHRATTVATAAGCPVVRTQPLPPGALVSTRSLGAERMVATIAGIGVVHTLPGAGSPRLINDEELLTLAAPQQPALVRTGPHTQELIFLAPAESDARRLN